MEAYTKRRLLHDLVIRHTQPGKSDRKCAGYTGNHVLQRDCNARAGDTECNAEAAQAVFKENREEDEDCDVSGKRRRTCGPYSANHRGQSAVEALAQARETPRE